MNLTAHQFPAVYERHGIDLSRLGCVMLDVETPGWLARALRPEWLYTSPNQSHHWITGLQTRSHVTLRYGLLPDVVPLDVDEVLADWSKPDVVRVTGLRAFGSPFPDEDYRCIIGMVERADVIEAWRRLGFLPNVTRYDRYQPHVTLAYVHAARVEPAFAAINDAASFPFSLTALGLDYGDVIGGAK